MKVTRQLLNACTGMLLMGCALHAYAIPTLTFDGTVNFDAGTGALSVTSELTSSTGIAPSPTLLGSSLTFTAILDTSFTDGVFTYGMFDGVPGDDLTVTDGTPATLLTGEFVDLTMFGVNASLSPGQNSATLTGTINATGGALAGLFDVSNLIAMELNLTTVVEPDMFNTDYSGDIDGRLESASIPEPAGLALLGLGLLLIGMMRITFKTGVHLASHKTTNQVHQSC